MSLVINFFSYYLAPKIAEPSLTIVAPSLIARSKSDDIPIESVSSVADLDELTLVSSKRFDIVSHTFYALHDSYYF